jgi:hypothetical protein
VDSLWDDVLTAYAATAPEPGTKRRKNG